MKEKDKRHTRRVRNLVILLALTTMILAVSTYAWFIGNRTVNVSPFDVQIAATEDLQLSLDGVGWFDAVEINQGNFGTVNQGTDANNTNSWGGSGLRPVSSVGDIDTAASRLTLYEKGSLTKTPGGYRLMASQVPNTDPQAPEADGYVAFDLFVKNMSGTEYYTAPNSLDEEAIYLAADSAVTVSSAGVANTGIENSVRVAFAQIGRVKADTTTKATITGITCNLSGGAPAYTEANGVTGICRTAQIWEPNDKAHVTGAINYYNTSCRPRTGADVFAAGAYDLDDTCAEIVDGTAYSTYAIAKEIGINDTPNLENSVLDVYDGEDYNGYTASVGEDQYLQEYPYFTDTDKVKTSVERPEIFTLAPNSITKVRVYIYLEGQDIDNYDWAAIGKAITVNFGFTKQRFNPEDGDPEDPMYTGPSLRPVITLAGNETMELELGTPYVEPGVTASDMSSGTAVAIPNSEIMILGNVNENVLGTYIKTYRVTGYNSYTTTVTRTINVVPVSTP